MLKQSATVNAAWVSGIFVLLAAVVAAVATMSNKPESPAPDGKASELQDVTASGDTAAESAAMEVSGQGNIAIGPRATENIVATEGSVVTINEDTKTADLLEKGLPESVYVVVDIDNDTSDQIRLFPQDEVEVFAPSGNLTEVWFGKDWERCSPGNTYVVWGIVAPDGPEPVTPKFKGTGSLKIKVSFTRYRDELRDLRPPHEPVPKK